MLICCMLYITIINDFPLKNGKIFAIIFSTHSTLNLIIIINININK